MANLYLSAIIWCVVPVRPVTGPDAVSTRGEVFPKTATRHLLGPRFGFAEVGWTGGSTTRRTCVTTTTRRSGAAPRPQTRPRPRHLPPCCPVYRSSCWQSYLLVHGVPVPPRPRPRPRCRRPRPSRRHPPPRRRSYLRPRPGARLRLPPGRTCQILPAASSNAIDTPFISQIPSHDVAGDIRQALAHTARHVKRSRLTPETRVQNALDEVASAIW